jgi:hypothetical protein
LIVRHANTDHNANNQQQANRYWLHRTILAAANETVDGLFFLGLCRVRRLISLHFLVVFPKCYTDKPDHHEDNAAHYHPVRILH